MELRCENGIKFGDLIDGVIEVRCRSNRCGVDKGAGVVVLHRFDALTGKSLGTKRFKDPSTRKRVRV